MFACNYFFIFVWKRRVFQKDMFNDDEISHNMGNEAIRGYTEVVRKKKKTFWHLEVGL